jgi:hypothetical protein
MYTTPRKLKSSQAVSKPDMQIDFTHGKEIYSDYDLKVSVQTDTVRAPSKIVQRQLRCRETRNRKLQIVILFKVC